MTAPHFVRASLLAGVCLSCMAAIGVATPAFATTVSDAGTQGQPAPEPDRNAQSQPQDEEDSDFGTDSGADSEETDGEIVVQGRRLRGQLDVEQAPLLELNEEDIAAEGVASIGDLIQQIQNQTGSARGRGGGGFGVLLVNGIRPGSFREIFSYPPEALAKVEVFPEEVAQRFGFPPDQRVINLILKDNYASREVEFEFEGPSRGGRFVNEQEFGLLQIANGGRFNFNFTAQDASLLTESERDIIQTEGSTSDLDSDPDQAEFRSLLPDTRGLDASVSWARAYTGSGISLSANAAYERDDSRSLGGLNLVTLTDADGDSLTRTFGENDPLERRTATDTASLAGALSKPVNAFRLTSTVEGGLVESTTEIDNQFDTSDLEQAALDGTLALDGALPSDAEAGFETAFSRRWNALSRNTLRGPIANLPGGEVITTFDLGYVWNRIESADTRTDDDVQLTRGNLQTGANFVIPITSRRNGFADALGSFTLNAQVGVDELSDFGTLGDYNVSLNWSPFDGLDLSGTYIYREVAPGLTSLGDPQITNFNVPVFDFVNGETVLADVTTGGNPDLPAETQQDMRFAANFEVPFVDGTRFTVEYIRNRSDDVTSAFPQVTEEIEAAFPDRVTRDANGTLIALDRRPVSFSETRSDRLQFRLSTRGGFGQGSSGGRGGRGGRPGGRPEGAGGRGGPPSQAPSQASANANSSRSPAAAPTAAQAGGPPSGRRAEAFMALREKLCAEDGLALMKQIVETAQSGGDVSALVPGLPPQMVERMLSRLTNTDGEVTEEQLKQARNRICSMEGRPGGRGGPPGGRPDGQGGPGRPGMPTPQPEQMAAIQARLCGENGLVEMRKLVAMVERGEDVSAILPGMDPAFLKFGLERMRAADGTIPDEALERMRGRICASAKSQSSSGDSGQVSGAPPAPAFNPLARGGRSGWRYFANLTHTIELQNEILIAPGVEVLDQLDGDATGAFGFPRHSSRLEAGLFGNGIGFRLSGRYTGETRLDGSGTADSSDLFFDDLLTFNLRVFSNVDQITGSKSPLLKNMRISLRMDNVFDGQRAVRDENGDTPVNYQPFVIDPVGRFVGIDIRKLF
ncbi:MAG: hypothetical protein AAFR64_03690 [Pseudomonadota bacterium]